MSRFSLVWPLAVVALLVVGMFTLSAIELLGLVLALTAVGNLVFGVVLRFKLFPTGTKKIRLLLQRRASIGVNFLHIFLVILPLFYVDLLCINQGKFYQALQKPSRC